MSQTSKCLFISFIISIAVLLPHISYNFGAGWAIESTPLRFLSHGMSYMDVFFHEIGHTLFSWFYATPALPSFDFQHGGGMAYSFEKQNILNVVLYAFLIGGIFYFKEERGLQIILICVGLFHIATAYNDWAEILQLFMGHGFSILVGSFFLYRALLDLAPRGALERYLNAIIGFGIIFHNMILFWGLMKSDAMRQSYSQQKGMHGFGDLSRISNYFFQKEVADVALWGFAFAIIGLVIPFILYRFSDARYIDKYGND